MTTKVLYITYDGLTDPIGQSQVLPYVIELQKQNIEYTILSFEKKDRYKAYKDDIKKITNAHNIRWIPLKYHKRFSVLATSFDIYQGFQMIRKINRKTSFDIVHARSYIAGVLGYLSKKKLQKKFIFDIRGFWVDERAEGKLIRKNGLLYKVLKKLEKKLMLSADKIVTLTHSSVQELSNWDYFNPKNTQKIVQITTCCNINEFSKALPIRLEKTNNEITFGYVGSIGPWHSKDEIFGFVDVAYHSVKNSKFLMIINWGIELFHKFLEQNDYDQSRFVVKSLPHDEIPNALESVDIGFFFIPPKYAKIASSPTKMGEMLSAGIPIVTGHSIGDVDQLVDQYRVGFVVQQFNPEAYNKAIQHVLALYQQDKNALAERCLSLANDYFSLEKGVEKYLKIYRELTNHGLQSN